MRCFKCKRTFGITFNSIVQSGSLPNRVRNEERGILFTLALTINKNIFGFKYTFLHSFETPNAFRTITMKLNIQRCYRS